MQHVRGAAEYAVKYLGTIPRLLRRDAHTSRAAFFEEIDSACAAKELPWEPKNAHILTMSMYGIKVTERNNKVCVKHRRHRSRCLTVAA